jgi:hypothetical protein
LDQLQRQLAVGNQLEKVAAVNAERERVGAAAQPALGSASGSGLLSPEATRRLLQLPEKDWLIVGDILAGHYEDSEGWKSGPLGPSAEMHFSFKMKARSYQGIKFWVGGESYHYSHGFWANSGSGFWAEGKETHLPGTVTSPEKWALLSVVVKDGKIRFSYNGKMEVERTLKPPKQAGYLFNVGFTNYKNDVQIRDCTLDLAANKR